MLLEFELKNQYINRTDTFRPMAKSENYLFAHFTPVTDEWKDQIITAIFTKDDVSYEMLLDNDNTCAVPQEVIRESGEVYVSCFCGDLITVNKSRVVIGETGYVESGENTEEPTPNIYNQLTTKFNELRQYVDEQLENIDGGLFTDWEE